jgi:hypothetical protein
VRRAAVSAHRRLLYDSDAVDDHHSVGVRVLESTEGDAMLKLSPILFAVLPLIAADVRLSNDSVTKGGYVSAYTIATGTPYTDPVIQECGIARGRQNEPAVAMNPRDPRVIVGSSNDYCGVYAGSPVDGVFVPSGPVWLGYYRSENAGQSFRGSLVPGYPGDTSPYGALAKVRTAGAGDPVLAWDNQGRLFVGAESSDDPSGTKKTFGDVWVARFDNPDGPNGIPSMTVKRSREASLWRRARRRLT